MADWVAIEAEYVCGADSLANLAKKYHLSKSALGRRSSVCGWKQKRAEYRAQIIKKVYEKTQATRTREGVKKLEALQAAADQLGKAIEQATNDSKQVYRHIVQDAMGETVERVYQKADARAMRDLAATIRDLTAAVRSLYNLPTVKEQHDMELADRKFEAEQARDEATQEVVVRIEADQPTEGWAD